MEIRDRTLEIWVRSDEAAHRVGVFNAMDARRQNALLEQSLAFARTAMLMAAAPGHESAGEHGRMASVEIKRWIYTPKRLVLSEEVFGVDWADLISNDIADAAAGMIVSKTIELWANGHLDADRLIQTARPVIAEEGVDAEMMDKAGRERTRERLPSDNVADAGGADRDSGASASLGSGEGDDASQSGGIKAFEGSVF